MHGVSTADIHRQSSACRVCFVRLNLSLDWQTFLFTFAQGNQLSPGRGLGIRLPTWIPPRASVSHSTVVWMYKQWICIDIRYCTQYTILRSLPFVVPLVLRGVIFYDRNQALF